MNAVLPVKPTDYVVSARRHLRDAHFLMTHGSRANAGQLLGFSIECGLKALLIASGITQDADGGIASNTKFRQHMPTLDNRIVSEGHLIPDGPRTTHYRAMLPSLSALSDWKVDHRYYREAALPLTSLNSWDLAALELNDMLDQAIVDGVM